MPQPDLALLPDDPALLKALVLQLLEELQKANARLQRQEHHMHLLLKRLYGSTSEKRDPRQGVLFDSQSGVEAKAEEAARMETALAWIGKLYAVEKDLRERCQGEWQTLAFEERAGRIAQERQKRSRPLLADFHAWLEVESPKVLPKSDVARGDGLRLEQLGGAVRLQRGRLAGHRQQRGRELAPRPLPGAKELAVPRQRPRRTRRSHPFQPAGILQAARSRSLGLLSRHSHPSARHVSRSD